VSEIDDVRALMEADRWVDRVTSQKTHLPEQAELAALEAELRQLLKDLQEAESIAAPVKSEYESAAHESTQLRDRARDLDARLSSSTANARELTAIQGELTHVRGLLAENEDRELELLMLVEPLEENVVSIKATAQPGVARRGELVDTIAQLRATLDDELVALRESRVAKAAALPGPLLVRYEAALKRSGTSGASQVIEGRCDGCRIALSPLDYDRFKSLAPDTFMDCPECGRLLLP
jgi:predicted  nucleic acid-binding Zn-ribbon protein